MTISVSEALCSENSQIVTVERKAVGAYVDGIYQEGATTTFKSICSVQHPSPADLQILPEGERDSDIRKFISKKSIRTTSDRDALIADVILHKDIRYKVISASDWGDFGYTRSFGARVR